MKGQLTFQADHGQLELMIINQKVSSAYEDYYQVKAQKDSREKWIGQIIEAQAIAKNTTKA